MAKFKFTVSRRSITLETYEVEADTESEALEIAQNGEVGDPVLEFIDWYDDEYEIDDVEEINHLYNMVKEYDNKVVDTLDV
jgi:hypothetical protein